MKFTNYIAEAERHYHFRVKTVVPLGDKEMDRIELAVAKYQPISLSRAKKTMLQKHPMDFKDVENVEVYIVDMVLGLPASPYVLQQDIRQNLQVPEKYVVVRGDNEPLEVEGERLAALADIAAEAKKRGLKPASLLADEGYDEVESVDGKQFYGNEHNSALLAYIQKVRDERESDRIDPPNPLFKWLDMPDRNDQEPKQDTTDFNATLVKIKRGPEARPEVANHGQNHDGLTVTRLYKDAKGNRVRLTRKMDSVRGEKA